MLGAIAKLFGVGDAAGKAIATPIEAIGNVFDKLFTSDEERAHAAAVMEKLRQHPGELQVQLNMIEAQHSSVWVAGWRPYIGWVCGTSLAAYFLPQFILGAWVWVMACLHVMRTVTITADNILIALPPYPVNGNNLMELVYALLGLGILRTVEKGMDKAK